MNFEWPTTPRLLTQVRSPRIYAEQCRQYWLHCKLLWVTRRRRLTPGVCYAARRLGVPRGDVG